MFSFNHNIESPQIGPFSSYRVLYAAPIQTSWVVYDANVLNVEAKIIIIIFDYSTSVPKVNAVIWYTGSPESCYFIYVVEVMLLTFISIVAFFPRIAL